MRATHDKYALEHQQIDVALRLIRHEARSRTIREFTGLSDDRIRKLYRTYAMQAQRVPARRKRGKAAQLPESIIRSNRAYRDAALFAGTLSTIGLIDTTCDFERILTPLTLATMLCDAYELYLHLVHRPQFEFDRAYSLWRSIQVHNDLVLHNCVSCSGLLLHDPMDLRPRACPCCGDRDPIRRPTLPRRQLGQNN